MTANELIEQLQENLTEEQLDLDLIVAQQPNYPLSGKLLGIAINEAGEPAIVSDGAYEYSERALWEKARENSGEF